MKLSLSKDAQIFLFSSFFLILAFSSVYGLYDNRLYLDLYPFYLIAIADIIFGGLFLYSAYSIKKLLINNRRFLIYLLVAFWLYTTIVGFTSLSILADGVGIYKISQSVGQSVILYTITQITYIAILPALAFGFLIWLIKKWTT